MAAVDLVWNTAVASMIAFLIPLPHPKSCRSYSRVASLLEDTLLSVCSQEDPDYHVIVICSERPSVSFDHPKVEYLRVNFEPLRAVKKGLRTDRGIRTDKGCRLFLGLQHARKFEPSHVMFVDDDDFISNRISAHVKGYHEANGWFIQRGYRYAHGCSRLAVAEDFNKRCGSCHIIRYELLEWHEELPTDASKEEIISKVDSYYLKRVIGGHRRAPRFFARKGTPLQPLPFRGAVYHLNHGGNFSGRRSYGNLATVPLTDELRREFSIPHHCNKP